MVLLYLLENTFKQTCAELEKVELEWHKIFCPCLYLCICTKNRNSGTQVWVLSG